MEYVVTIFYFRTSGQPSCRQRGHDGSGTFSGKVARMEMEKLGGDLKGSLAVHVARLSRGASRLEDG